MSRSIRALPAERMLAALLRALAHLLGEHRLVEATCRDWASATFEGARHRLAIMLDGADAAMRAATLQATLTETELVIAGGFVADITVVTRPMQAGVAIGIEALTIIEPPPAVAARPMERSLTGDLSMTALLTDQPAISRAARPAG